MRVPVAQLPQLLSSNDKQTLECIDTGGANERPHTTRDLGLQKILGFQYVCDGAQGSSISFQVTFRIADACNVEVEEIRAGLEAVVTHELSHLFWDKGWWRSLSYETDEYMFESIDCRHVPLIC